MSSSSIFVVAFAAALTVLPAAAGQRQVFTATAVQGDGANERSMPVTFVINRYTTDAEHESAVAALNGSPSRLHDWLATLPDIGEIQIAGQTIPLKYAYRRSKSFGRITVVANTPLLLDGLASEGQRPEGFDFAAAILDLSLPGFGAGELDPAVALSVNSNGQIQTEAFGASAVRLTDVRSRQE